MKDRKNTTRDELLSEYNFSGAVRGKYHKRFSEGTNIVLLDEDVAEIFRDSETVNKTLRAATEIIKLTREKPVKTKV